MNFAAGVFWDTERGREIFGYSPGEVIDMERFEASVHPDDRNLVLGATEQSVRAGEPVNSEYRIIIAIGLITVVAGAAMTQAHQATAQQVENFKKAFSVCLEGKKYLETS